LKNRPNTVDPGIWYDENKEIHDSLRQTIEDFTHNILNEQGLKEGSDFVFAEFKIKTRDSFIQKMNKIDREGKLKYSDPKQITDIVRARIVGYVLSDISPLSALVERYFDIDWERSIDKFNELGESQVGTRSKNYIARLNRTVRKAKSRFENLYFEIQLETLLNYAWSEIEHDRNYKTAIELPQNSDIPRRFRILAGVLELADNEFERLSKETQAYAKPIPSRIINGDLNIEVSAYSLRQFFTIKFNDIPRFSPYFGWIEHELNELESLGIKTLSQLDMIIPTDFKQRYVKVLKDKLGPNNPLTFSAILLDILIIHFRDQYFEKATQRPFTVFLENYHYNVFQEFGLKIKLPRGWEWED
jgi:putative GTP pyrophosphokinase